MSPIAAMYAMAAPPGTLVLWLGFRGVIPNSDSLEFFFTTAAGRSQHRANGQQRFRLDRALLDEDVELGTYTFTGLPAGSYKVELRFPGQTIALETRVRSSFAGSNVGAGEGSAQPGLAQKWCLAMSSCFWFENANRSKLNRAVAVLAKREPVLMMLLGDQVYTDLPLFKNYEPNYAFLYRALYQWHYLGNFFGRLGHDDGKDLQPLLRLAPFVCVADDHEYWNNAPHEQWYLPTTSDVAGRDAWMSAGQALYGAFQLGKPELTTNDLVRVIDCSPLSVCIADFRSLRTKGFELAPEAAWLAIEAWASQTIANNQLPIFVTGQSLLRDQGNKDDFEMTMHAVDYRRLIRIFQRFQLPLLFVSGDVHFGSVAGVGEIKGSIRCIEVLCSPTARIPWPFGEPVPDPADGIAVAQATNGTWRALKQFQTEKNVPALVRREQLGLLSFKRQSGRIEAHMEYLNLDNPEQIAHRVFLYSVLDQWR